MCIHAYFLSGIELRPVEKVPRPWPPVKRRRIKQAASAEQHLIIDSIDLTVDNATVVDAEDTTMDMLLDQDSEILK